MDNDSLVKKWHRDIIADAERKLGRGLKGHEKTFITSRRGFIALEMIHDTIKAGEREEIEEIEKYLSSELAIG